MGLFKLQVIFVVLLLSCKIAEGAGPKPLLDDCEACIDEQCTFCHKEPEEFSKCICDFPGPFFDCNDFVFGANQYELHIECLSAFYPLKLTLIFVGIVLSIIFLCCCTTCIRNRNSAPSGSTEEAPVDEQLVLATEYQPAAGEATRGIAIAAVAAPVSRPKPVVVEAVVVEEDRAI
mmetsp:Transcript_8907/g.10182  ORF Transcript_8907/g.10182 Transcript_8907/m.10182 type:complete len:176 (+) Transcript_8907:206-733(+)